MTALWSLDSKNISVALKQPPVSTRYWPIGGAAVIEVNATLLTVRLLA
jgi:hypothetical protein